jgi:hypothetical protein
MVGASNLFEQAIGGVSQSSFFTQEDTADSTPTATNAVLKKLVKLFFVIFLFIRI